MGTYCQKNGPDKMKYFENNRHKQKEFDNLIMGDAACRFF